MTTDLLCAGCFFVHQQADADAGTQRGERLFLHGGAHLGSAFFGHLLGAFLDFAGLFRGCIGQFTGFCGGLVIGGAGGFLGLADRLVGLILQVTLQLLDLAGRGFDGFGNGGHDFRGLAVIRHGAILSRAIDSTNRS